MLKGHLLLTLVLLQVTFAHIFQFILFSALEGSLQGNASHFLRCKSTSKAIRACHPVFPHAGEPTGHGILFHLDGHHYGTLSCILVKFLVKAKGHWITYSQIE